MRREADQDRQVEGMKHRQFQLETSQELNRPMIFAGKDFSCQRFQQATGLCRKR